VNQHNEQLFRAFIAAFEAGDNDTIQRLVDPDIVDHTLPPGAAPGIAGLLYAVNSYREGFPDVRISVDSLVSDEDRVVGYGRITGTNTGSFFVMPPTGRTANFGYIDIYRIDHDRITEAWHLEDIAGLTRQLTLEVAAGDAGDLRPRRTKRPASDRPIRCHRRRYPEAVRGSGSSRRNAGDCRRAARGAARGRSGDRLCCRVRSRPTE
jgi:predicted ester cyclase